MNKFVLLVAILGFAGCEVARETPASHAHEFVAIPLPVKESPVAAQPETVVPETVTLVAVPEPVAEPPAPSRPAAPALTGSSFRVWTSLSGAQVEAEFIKVSADEVYLRKRDASTVRIRLASLRPGDQRRARELGGPVFLAAGRERAPEEQPESLGLRIGRGKEWTVLRNCRYLSHAGNDGDSFHVRHGGKEYIFRLYYVDAPETSMEFPDRVGEQAAYFRLPGEEALRVGDTARKFTERILSETSFTVVTRWEDARGNSRLPRYFAFITTTQGDLDELLAAEGLVRIYGMRVDDKLGARKGKVLRALEKDARRAGSGAWGVNQGGGSAS